MLAKCSMVGKHIHQYRSQELLCIPVVILTKIKMLFKVIFIQLLLLCVHSSTALNDPVEILVQPIRNRSITWTSKNLKKGEEGYYGLLFEKHFIPGLDRKTTKNIAVDEIQSDHFTFDTRGGTQELFGMLPLFMQVTGEQYEIAGRRNKIVLPANGIFRLACATYGFHHFNTAWINGKGQIIPSGLYSNHDGKTNYDAAVLRLNIHDAEINSRSYGCQFKDRVFGVNAIMWFNFTIIEKIEVKLAADVSTCGQVMFTCLNGNSKPEEVEWTVNGVNKSIGPYYLTLRSNETVLNRVKCAVKSQHSSSIASLDFDNSQIFNCHDENETVDHETEEDDSPLFDGQNANEYSTIGLAIAGIITTMLLIVFAYFIKRWHSLKRSNPSSESKNHIPKHNYK